MRPEVSHIDEYGEMTTDLVLSLLSSAYEDELKLDKALKELSEDVFAELEKELQRLERDGKLDLNQPFDLHRNPAVYEALKRIETIQLRRLIDYYWIASQVIKESLIRSYNTTLQTTYGMFDYEVVDNFPVVAEADPMVKVRDTYIYEKAIKVPWCQDGKTYSDRLYNHVANFRSKLAFVLEEGVNKGKGMGWMKESWRKLTGSTAYATSRLLKTETMAMWSLATKESYLAMGIEYVVIVGSAICGGICLDYVNNTPIRLMDAYAGDLLPPYHPGCACSYIAYKEDIETFLDEKN